MQDENPYASDLIEDRPPTGRCDESAGFPARPMLAVASVLAGLMVGLFVFPLASLLLPPEWAFSTALLLTFVAWGMAHRLSRSITI